MPFDANNYQESLDACVNSSSGISQKTPLKGNSGILSAMRKAGCALVGRAGARAVLSAILVAVAALAAPHEADASIVTITVTGTVSSGTDVSGVFGPPNTNLAVDSFTVTYTFDDTKGTQSVCSSPPCYQSDIVSTATSNPGTAVLKIGGGQWTFGSLPAQVTNSIAQNEVPPGFDSAIYFSVNDTGYSGANSGGSDAVQIQLYPASNTPPLTLNYNWEGSLARQTQIIDGSLARFAIAATINGVSKNASGYFTVTGITVDGPESADATANSLGAASCLCPNQPPPDNENVSKPADKVGDPITVSSGNVFEYAADYATVGQNPLSFTRYYNSLGNSPGILTFASELGTNWRSTYDRYLQLGPSTISAERSDGRILSFTQTGGNWVSDTDVDVKLTQAGSVYTLTDHNDTVETYNTESGTLGTLIVSFGQLANITARDGYTQTMNYSGGELSSVSDSYGRSLNFTYSGGFLRTVTTPDSLVLTYDVTPVTGGHQLTSVSYNTGPATSQTYLYENTSFPFALTGITDEKGNSYATWTYDAFGNAKTSQHGTGTSTNNLTTMTYNSNGTTTATNALGVADTYSFSNLHNALKVTQISRAAASSTAAATRTFAYDSNGYLNSDTDWNGNQTTYVNNSHGQPTTINEAVGSTVTRTTTISYDPTFVHLPHQIITPGLTSTFVYDGSGNPLTRTDTDTTTSTVPYSTAGQARVTTWTWSSTGEKTSVQLPRTDVAAKTSFTYDSTGALTQIADALGHLTKITSHTGGGLPETIVDPNGVITTLTYDGRLNLNTSTLSTTAGKLTTTFTHDAANELTAMQLPDNSKLTYGYDTAHRLTSITDLLGNSIAYTLDALGDRTLVEVKNPSGTATRQHSATFDALGRVLDDVGGAGQTTAYTHDKNGNVLTVTPPSPSGAITYTYDALNRLSTARDPSPGGTTTLTYDAHDRALTVKDANNNTTSYVYNGFGDRTETASPDSGTTVMYVNPDRDVTQIVKPGPLTANMTYDALDRPLATTYPSGSTLNVSHTYDQTGHGFGVGRLTSATDQVGSLSLTYDERGNATKESRVVTSAGTLNTTTTFDAASRVSGIAYPSGTLVAYGRDSMGRVTSVTAKPPGATSASNVATGITYEPFGPETGLTFGNGIKGAYGYDLDYRPTTRVDTGTAAVQSLTYAYFANNSVQTITDAVNAANTQTLGYDALDRLTSAASGTGGYGAYGFTWDPVSNIKTEVINGTTTTYSLATGTNRLSQWVTGSTTEVVVSTPAGNINTLKIGTATQETLTYNQANQMASSQTLLSAATYKYDLTGQRLEKAVAGSSYPILYQYSRTGGQLLSENDLHKGQTADYIYLNGRPIAEANPTTGKLYFTHTDRLGTPQRLTDSTKAVAWNATYLPFGGTGPFSVSGTLTTQSLRLPGQLFDAETGYNHNGFRDYAAGLTRYVESDPIGLAGGMNTYQYVNNNPFRWIDPSGLDGESNPQNSTQQLQSYITIWDTLAKAGPYISGIPASIGATIGRWCAPKQSTQNGILSPEDQVLQSQTTATQTLPSFTNPNTDSQELDKVLNERLCATSRIHCNAK